MWSAIISAIGSGLNRVTGLASAIPGPMETQYRKDIKSERKRLQGGAGGMTDGQRQSLQAQAQGSINAKLQQGMAQQTRGMGMSPESGASAALQSDLYRQAGQESLQAQSSIRKADIDLASAQRDNLRAMMLNAVQMTNQRKAMANSGGSGSSGGSSSSTNFQEMGAASRQNTGTAGMSAYESGNY